MNATPRKSTTDESAGYKPMAVKDKIKIIAMHLRGLGKKAIAGATGFPMDWVELVTNVFGEDREFIAAATRLNEGKTYDDVTISEGHGGAKRG